MDFLNKSELVCQVEGHKKYIYNVKFNGESLINNKDQYFNYLQHFFKELF